MVGLFLYLLKVAVIQLIAWLGYRLLLEREPLGHLKRGYLLGSLAVAFVLPFVVVWRLNVPELAYLEHVLPPGTNLDSVPMSTTGTINSVRVVTTVLLSVYSVFAFRRAVPFVLFLRRIRRQLTTASGKAFGPGATWVSLPYPTRVHTFGAWVFHTENVRLSAAVRAHELAHARQFHSFDRVVLAILRIVWWFNPVLALYERSLTETHELLADRAALNTGLTAAEYAQQILQSFQSTGSAPRWSSGLSFSFTKQRFLMLRQNPSNVRLLGGKILGLALLWAVLAAGFGRTVYAGNAFPQTAITADTLPPPPLPPVPSQQRANRPPPPPPVSLSVIKIWRG